MEENKLYKIIAIVLALSIVFTIITANVVSITGITLLKAGGTIVANTNGSGGGEDNTEKETDVIAPDDTPAAVDDTQSSGTADPTNTGGNTTTTKPQGTAQKSKADIVKIFNEAVNNTKKYQGTVEIKRKQGTTTTILAISPEAVRGTAEDMLPNDWPKEKTGTYTKGVNAEGDSINRILPPDKQTYGSKLTEAGVKTASYTAVGSGAKVVITLVEEKGDDINFVPPHHASCMDTLSLTAEDLKPFTLKKATITYSGATITAEINSKGLVTSLKISEPANVQGNLSLSFIPLVNAEIEGLWRQELTLIYK